MMCSALHALDLSSRLGSCGAAVKMAYPGMSLPMLGRLFKRDHTTLLHALKVRGLR